MASERDIELLDDFIGNRLEGAEKSAFEEKLRHDADLQTELKFQQNIVEGLKKARAAELKTFLKNIPTSAIPANPVSWVRWSGVGVAVLVGAGLYISLKPEKEQSLSTVADTTSVIEQPSSSIPPSAIDEKPKEEEKPGISTEPATERKTTKAKKVLEPSPSNEASAPASPHSPGLDVFDPSEDNTPESKGPENVTRSASEEPVTSKADIIAEVRSNDKSYTFHYQFTGEKLVLYGPFDKNLYEILEFISDNKHTIFLFYNNSYYLLNQGTEKVKPLSPVTEPVLLQKLKDHRSK